MIIENLCKVTVKTEVNTPVSAGRREDTPLCFDFIYGIARDGFSSFERELYQKSTADVVCVSVPKAWAAEYFGPSFQHLRKLFDSTAEAQSLDLRFTVLSVQQGRDKEIIQAMSRNLGHCCGGSGCDCGCS